LTEVSILLGKAVVELALQTECLIIVPLTRLSFGRSDSDFAAISTDFLKGLCNLKVIQVCWLHPPLQVTLPNLNAGQGEGV
jgi:hypothetical protein